MYLVFDVGTTTMKTSVFDRSFQLLFFAANEYQLMYLPGNRIELSAEFYWQSLKAGVLSAKQAGIPLSNMDSVTITTQGETLIPVDKNGTPLSNAVVWLDARAGKEARQLSECLDMRHFFRTTGLAELGAAAPIAKLMWIRNNEPEIYEKTEKFLLLEDYLIYRLTGEFVSEYSLLSSTGYFDITKNCYWNDILDLAGINADKLPTPYPCAKIVGGITEQAAQDTGLRNGTAVTTGAMDQIAGAVGAGNFKAGIVTETTGTCLVLAATVKMPNFDIVDGRFSIYKHFDENYLYLPYNPTAAMILKWFKDHFMSDLAIECGKTARSVYQEMDKIVEESPAGANGLIMLPHFSGKLVPDFNEEATGVFYGVGLKNTRGDFIRSILEGVAYMLRENIECLEETGIEIHEIRSLGGGSRSDVWMHIKADICKKQLVQSHISEFTSLGAAMLGALAVDHYSSVEEIDIFEQSQKQVYLASANNHAQYERAYQDYLLLYQSIKIMSNQLKGDVK